MAEQRLAETLSEKAAVGDGETLLNGYVEAVPNRLPVTVALHGCADENAEAREGAGKAPQHRQGVRGDAIGKQDRVGGQPAGRAPFHEAAVEEGDAFFVQWDIYCHVDVLLEEVGCTALNTAER